MELERSADVECPYCGETFTTFVDLSSGSTDYIEDCQVCCRPIQFHLEVTDLETGDFELSTDASG